MTALLPWLLRKPSQLSPSSATLLSLRSPQTEARQQCPITQVGLDFHPILLQQPQLLASPLPAAPGLRHGSAEQVGLPRKLENRPLCTDVGATCPHSVRAMNSCHSRVEGHPDQWDPITTASDITIQDSETDDDNVSRMKLKMVPTEVIGHGDKEVVNAICNRIRTCAWDASTEPFLDEHHAVHVCDLLVAKVIIRQRDVVNASSFFQWACRRIGYGTQSCHAYLMKLGDGRHFSQMWEVLARMESSNCKITGETFCIFIKACGTARQPGMAVGILKKALEYNDVKIDIRIYTELIRGFFLSRHVDEARICYSRILRDGLNLDRGAISCLIRGFVLSCNVPDALSFFNAMLREGFRPDSLTYNSLIQGLCSINALNDAMKSVIALQEQDLRPTVSTFNIIIESLCRTDRLDDAMDVFTGMRTTCLPNQSTFNTLLQGLLKGNSVLKAIEFFTIMENEGCVDANSFLYLSNGLRQAKQTHELCSFLKTLFAKYSYRNQEICVALLNSLCHSGSIEEAETFFTNMAVEIKDFNICSYAMMISCYCRLEKIHKAVDLLTQLKSHGGSPSCFCYTPLIAALLKGKRIADAMEYFEEMVSLGLEVNAITCNFLLQELCEQSMADEALIVCRAIMKNKLTIRSGVLFMFMKCLYNKRKVEEADSMFIALCEMHCLPNRRGISQALGVRDRMGTNVYC